MSSFRTQKRDTKEQKSNKLALPLPNRIILPFPFSSARCFSSSSSLEDDDASAGPYLQRSARALGGGGGAGTAKSAKSARVRNREGEWGNGGRSIKKSRFQQILMSVCVTISFLVVSILGVIEVCSNREMWLL